MHNAKLGTSETIRLLNTSSKGNNKKLNEGASPPYNRAYGRGHLKFIQWLSGLIDGDGCFLISKAGYASLEITVDIPPHRGGISTPAGVDIRDERALRLIQHHYSGSVKYRVNNTSIRYRLHNKLGLITLINDINGEIRNPIRLIQLAKICNLYNIILKDTKPLTKNNAWLSGFFDADGTITINSTNNQLSISIGQKDPELLHLIASLFNGYVYPDNGKYKSYKWYITDRDNILLLLDYFKSNPSKTLKNNRIHLISKYYSLKDMKAYRADNNSLLYRKWEDLLNKWGGFAPL